MRAYLYTQYNHRLMRWSSLWIRIILSTCVKLILYKIERELQAVFIVHPDAKLALQGRIVWPATQDLISLLIIQHALALADLLNSGILFLG